MRTVLIEDPNGYLRAYLVRDQDPDEMAEQGIPLETPAIDGIEWVDVERDIHNALIRRGIFSTKELERSQDKVLGIVSRVVRRHVILKIKEEENNGY